MVRRRRLAGDQMLAQPPAPTPPKPAPAAAQPFGLGDIRIGMDLAALKAQPKVSCAPGKTQDVTICGGPDRQLGGGYFARDLTYRFVGGRLAQIRFNSSIDAFSWVTAQLKKDDGQPTAITRDLVALRSGARLPHVLMTWKNGHSTIALNDPVQSLIQLSVSITRDTAAAQLAQAHS
jgi:hypothetical protein